jgi:hypothetical protein
METVMTELMSRLIIAAMICTSDRCGSAIDYVAHVKMIGGFGLVDDIVAF